MADREFFSAECIDSLVRMDVPHLIPCKNTDRTVQRIREYDSGTAGRTSEMILTSADKSVPYTMTVAKRRNVRACATLPEERLIGFASNVPGIDVELYARWGIETGYSNIEGMRARTRSKNPAVMPLCFVYSVLMYNSWQIAKVLAGRSGKGSHITQTVLRWNISGLFMTGGILLPIWWHLERLLLGYLQLRIRSNDGCT